MTIEERLRRVVSAQLDVPIEDVTPEARFREDLGADSLDLVELVMALEDEFGAEIPDADAEGIRTVQDAIAYVTARATALPKP